MGITPFAGAPCFTCATGETTGKTLSDIGNAYIDPIAKGRKDSNDNNKTDTKVIGTTNNVNIEKDETDLVC